MTARSPLDCRNHLGQGARAGYEESTEWGTGPREGEKFKGEEGEKGRRIEITTALPSFFPSHCKKSFWAIFLMRKDLLATCFVLFRVQISRNSLGARGLGQWVENRSVLVDRVRGGEGVLSEDPVPTLASQVH